MKVYAYQKLPGVATNNLYLEHILNGVFNGGVRTRCYHYDLPEDEARAMIRIGICKPLKGRFDCVQSATRGQTDKVVY